ncbi:MAG: hypothetical protein LBS60_00315 [Deltaproteobacteria bacterium]|jgi:hypothetical protein|nr:hypothetical protein [Deltaproteobacteria bacterium]
MVEELIAFLNFEFSLQPKATKLVEGDTVTLVNRWSLNWREYLKFLASHGVQVDQGNRAPLDNYKNLQAGPELFQDLVNFQSELRQIFTDMIDSKKLPLEFVNRVFRLTNGLSTYFDPIDLYGDLNPENLDRLKIAQRYETTIYGLMIMAIVRDLIIQRRIFHLSQVESVFALTQPETNLGPMAVSFAAPTASSLDSLTPSLAAPPTVFNPALNLTPTLETKEPRPLAAEPFAAEPLAAEPIAAEPIAAESAEPSADQLPESLTEEVEASGDLTEEPLTADPLTQTEEPLNLETSYIDASLSISSPPETILEAEPKAEVLTEPVVSASPEYPTAPTSTVEEPNQAPTPIVQTLSPDIHPEEVLKEDILTPPTPAKESSASLDPTGDTAFINGAKGEPHKIIVDPLAAAADLEAAGTPQKGSFFSRLIPKVKASILSVLGKGPKASEPTLDQPISQVSGEPEVNQAIAVSPSSDDGQIFVLTEELILLEPESKITSNASDANAEATALTLESAAPASEDSQEAKPEDAEIVAASESSAGDLSQAPLPADEKISDLAAYLTIALYKDESEAPSPAHAAETAQAETDQIEASPATDEAIAQDLIATESALELEATNLETSENIEAPEGIDLSPALEEAKANQEELEALNAFAQDLPVRSPLETVTETLAIVESISLAEPALTASDAPAATYDLTESEEPSLEFASGIIEAATSDATEEITALEDTTYAFETETSVVAESEEAESEEPSLEFASDITEAIASETSEEFTALEDTTYAFEPESTVVAESEEAESEEPSVEFASDITEAVTSEATEEITALDDTTYAFETETSVTSASEKAESEEPSLEFTSDITEAVASDAPEEITALEDTAYAFEPESSFIAENEEPSVELASELTDAVANDASADNAALEDATYAKETETFISAESCELIDAPFATSPPNLAATVERIDLVQPSAEYAVTLETAVEPSLASSSESSLEEKKADFTQSLLEGSLDSPMDEEEFDVTSLTIELAQYLVEEKASPKAEPSLFDNLGAVDPQESLKGWKRLVTKEAAILAAVAKESTPEPPVFELTETDLILTPLSALDRPVKGESLSSLRAKTPKTLLPVAQVFDLDAPERLRWSPASSEDPVLDLEASEVPEELTEGQLDDLANLVEKEESLTFSLTAKPLTAATEEEPLLVLVDKLESPPAAEGQLAAENQPPIAQETGLSLETIVDPAINLAHNPANIPSAALTEPEPNNTPNLSLASPSSFLESIAAMALGNESLVREEEEPLAENLEYLPEGYLPIELHLATLEQRRSLSETMEKRAFFF